MRRCLRRLRAAPAGDPEVELVWGAALDSLGVLLEPAQAAAGTGESQRLSRRLGETLAELERAAQLLSDLGTPAEQRPRDRPRRWMGRGGSE
jgi:hypothetical protein